MKGRRRIVNREMLYWWALTGLLVSFFIWGINHLEGFCWDYDEGLNLIKARMVQLGYPLYTEIWSDHVPAFTISLALAFALFGSSVTVGRAMAVLYATVGLLGVALAARAMNGGLGSLVAAISLAAVPHFFELSRAAMLDMPAISLAALSIAFALYYLRTGGRRWLILAGVAFAASILMKLITAFVFLPLALVIPLRQRGHPWGEMAKDLGILACPIVLSIVLCFMAFDGRALIDQVVGTYLRGKGTYPLDIAYNGWRIRNYLVDDVHAPLDYGLVALATYGAVSFLLKRSKSTLIIIGWLALTGLSLLTHAPLFSHHLILLLFPLAVFVGIAIDNIQDNLRHFLAISILQRAILILGLGALTLYLLELPQMIRADQKWLAAPEDHYDRAGRTAARLIEEITEPNDFIIADYPMIAFRTGRKVPPSLCAPSGKRVNTGGLMVDELIAITEKYHPKAIVLWSRELSKMPAYVDWVIHRYRVAWWYGHRFQIYVPFDSTAIQHVQKVDLEDHITLLGYSIADLTVEPGETLHLTLYWRAREPIVGDYTAFVHLLDLKNRMWGQVDNIPVKGTYSTYHWRLGETIVDEYEIPVDPAAPAGEYLIEVGMYDVYTQKRLPIYGERLRNCILLETSLVIGGKELFASLADIQHPMRAALGNEVLFLGYSLAAEEVKPSGALHLTLYWEAKRRMDTGYTVFTHLLDVNGQIRGQSDGIPLEGRLPTTAWAVGEIIADPYHIQVSPDAAPGNYRLEIGLYNAKTGARLTAVDDTGQRLPQDRILLSQRVRVKK